VERTVTGFQFLFNLAVDSDAVYAGSSEGATRVDRTTLARTTLLKNPDPFDALNMALDGGYVYGSGNNGPIQRVPITGGTPETLVTGPVNVRALAAKGGTIYWTDGKTNQLMKLTIGDAAPTVLAPAATPDRSIALGPDGLYFSTIGSTSAALWRIGYAGGTLLMLDSGRYEPGWLVADSNDVYVLRTPGVGPTMGPSELLSVPPGGPPGKLATLGAGAAKLAVTSEAFYFAAYYEGTIRVLHRGDTADSVLRDAEGSPTAIAVDVDLIWATTSPKDGSSVLHIAQK
jgi:hypothetical protein